MRVGVVQMCSTDDVERNLRCAAEFVSEAVSRGAELVALPENVGFLRREGLPIPCRQDPDGPIPTALREMAVRDGVWLLGGTYPERIEGSQRVHNTSVLLDPSGRVVAHYRKIHLFDVELGDEGGSFRESEHFAPGDEVVAAPTPFGVLGLSVCYDLRFPELYRRLADAGAQIVAVPSAFSPHTGKDHWEVLLRARAIENQVWVLAPAQCGRHSPDRSSYGRSLVVDPWGRVVAQAGDRPGLLVADCDPAETARVRAAVPALSHRRLPAERGASQAQAGPEKRR